MLPDYGSRTGAAVEVALEAALAPRGKLIIRDVAVACTLTATRSLR
jgi:hypothetical protein